MKKNTEITKINNILNKSQQSKLFKIKLAEDLQIEVENYLKKEKDFGKRLKIITNYLENLFNAINGKKLLSYKDFIKSKIKKKRKHKKNNKKAKKWKL